MLNIGMSTDTTPAAPELSTAASDLRMATFRLARRLRSQRAVDTMSDGQFAVLAALSVHGQHTLGELADRERVSAPSMNRTVNGLEETLEGASLADRKAQRAEKSMLYGLPASSAPPSASWNGTMKGAVRWPLLPSSHST